MVSPQSSVFLFIGDEDYLIDKAIGALRSSIVDDASKDLDYKIFYGDETGAREILDCVTTFPFLSSKRLVVVKNFDRLHSDDISRLIDYIKKPSNFAYLILKAKDDSLLRKYPYINKYADIRRFGALADHEIYSLIKRFVSSRGKQIEESALEYLKELYGTNISLLMQELEKLITYIGGDQDIKLDDVLGVSGAGLAKSAFDLASAIGEKRTDLALRLVYDLTLRGKKPYEIIGLISWHLKRLLRAKKLQLRGPSDYSILKTLKVSRRHGNEFLKQARSFSAAHIEAKLKVLLESDIDIKRSMFEPRLILEFAVIRLCL